MVPVLIGRSWPAGILTIRQAVLDASSPPPSPDLLSAEEAKEKLREIVEGFFFRRLRTEGGKRICRRLDKTPPSLVSHGQFYN
jgi:hypothetical protein